MTSSCIESRNEPRVEIALFPIPDMVSFPGASVPLHVFEPRYRRMIRESIALQRPVGVCHVRKTINAGPRQQQTVAEALSTNQATYQPQTIFSAGPCRIQDELDDGRLLVLIDMQARYRMVSEQQALPYRVVVCEVLEDDEEDDGAAECGALQDAIIARVMDIASEPETSISPAELAQRWQVLTPQQFSYALFDVVRFDAHLMQSILEDTSVLSRLRVIADVLQAA